ncbi:hypothetical protein J2S13_003292 [Oikeobacillus pervagus]|uniref:Transposase DDE domain-containing protein n=1 Tax=Oikeobacillus pervagus TaxID=1325931 RepID=A0AAJ1T559_9BACI|nr:hypothetical protein [Oikeobacillus pervagus]MDQ0216806.1 hypothetical protein [Oikeobacillus pervagus]
MCNPKITTENYNTQMTLLPEKEEKKTSKRQLAPTFKSYDNRQIQAIFDIEALIPDHHVARVVDVEFGIVALAHNLLKVAGIRQLLSGEKRKNIKGSRERRVVFLYCLYFRDLLYSPTLIYYQKFLRTSLSSRDN